ncbi:DegT/DnrJ/EryC1/StrS family aminotransferase [Aestuariivivens sediminicola]|uniref:DegT/DnrJ/EryC1/StrS family aminotransferase n=1 Tax=Aestuariivivens sediminicola TaxID=2913560 RepID=UPI001F582E1E|nr:DegT/DnrJ/EryC1/StrS family aminotransferase [Aestuariivivens sediminicola]
MINVTKTFLPPQEEYQVILKKVWDNGWITNRGELVKVLEEELKAYLRVPNIICMTNGTLPLQIAIKALGLQGEIITTPFSYVASTSSIVWEGCEPVFVDIHPDYLTIDETKIEAAINSKTSAILVTHVFGNPCDVEGIERIAGKYGLKVIYDAAHCFGVTYKDHSIFSYGDISTCSFHATKLFHTGEGGAMVFKDDDFYNDFYYHHNFGHKGNEDFFGLGINAKMSELQAAMGLAVLPYLKSIIDARRLIVNIYNEQLQDTNLKFLKLRNHTDWNYSYYPIIFKNEKQLLKVVSALNSVDIFPRRYFYPSLDNLPYVKNQHCEISNRIAASILCLPLYHDITEEQQTRIVELIKAHL